MVLMLIKCFKTILILYEQFERDYFQILIQRALFKERISSTRITLRAEGQFYKEEKE